MIASDYRFMLTPGRGGFDQCRRQCQAMGGDLIHVNFGENGIKYHALVTIIDYYH